MPGFAEAQREVQQAIDAADWIEPTDLVVLDIFVRELNTYRRAAEALDRLGDTALLKKINAQKVQVRRARVLGELAGRMGFTAESRFKLGLTAAKTQRAQQGMQPVRSEERAHEIAAILARSGAIPPPAPPDAEVVEGEAEVVKPEAVAVAAHQEPSVPSSLAAEERVEDGRRKPVSEVLRARKAPPPGRVEVRKDGGAR